MLGLGAAATGSIGSATAAYASPDAHGRDTTAPIVIGHRGAPGYRPEHTLASYELAARMGADFVECDVVPTRDGHLVCRHEPEIGGTTDVARRPEFASRRTTKSIDGTSYTGWFTEDFTLAELRTLRAVERIPDIRPHNALYNGRYPVPTFDEYLALRARMSRELGREIGIYPEIKHSTYFAGIGLRVEPAFVAALDRHGLNRRGAPVFVQSFEVGNLKWLRERLQVPLVQLTDATGGPADLAARQVPRMWKELTTPAGLTEIARYADAIGPSKEQIVPLSQDGTSGPTTSLVGDAHTAGLLVHPYTFRNENAFVPAQLRRPGSASDFGDAFAEYSAIVDAGVDGVFSDNTDTAVAALRAN
ncbi:Glycerophosphoryl diester phosphodiesterase [Pseudonocardia sp. Ae706_Ps2]|uniref:glycerophosphodiester phosphodiesterase n=2 Tax=Pseudonocardia TaxID=1847 RepID=UPI00095F9A67|nr:MULTISPECIES: glycerophosphodiester phosphodiesterase [unclassified Pseudonocardia]OLM09512.1 Glycerophosphoryl diester phosphodiesterase [Pseudonocardia sp. Ae706_Ps2]